MGRGRSEYKGTGVVDGETDRKREYIAQERN